jgi:hypothetical protein
MIPRSGLFVSSVLKSVRLLLSGKSWHSHMPILIPQELKKVISDCEARRVLGRSLVSASKNGHFAAGEEVSEICFNRNYQCCFSYLRFSGDRSPS